MRWPLLEISASSPLPQSHGRNRPRRASRRLPRYLRFAPALMTAWLARILRFMAITMERNSWLSILKWQRNGSDENGDSEACRDAPSELYFCASGGTDFAQVAAKIWPIAHFSINVEMPPAPAATASSTAPITSLAPGRAASAPPCHIELSNAAEGRYRGIGADFLSPPSHVSQETCHISLAAAAQSSTSPSALVLAS